MCFSVCMMCRYIGLWLLVMRCCYLVVVVFIVVFYLLLCRCL